MNAQKQEIDQIYISVSHSNHYISENISDVFYDELLSRKKSELIHIEKNKRNKRNFHRVFFNYRKNLENDYCLIIEENSIHVKFKSEKIGYWLAYQYLDFLTSTNKDLSSDNLYPHILSFDESTCKNFDFSYREPHFSPNLRPKNNLKLGTHSVDLDWGIWGHNLHKIFSEEQPDEAYALINHKRNHKQFCFSSTYLRKSLETYILNNFGDGYKTKKKFMILPNDNQLVCNCNLCLEAGNTEQITTPSLVNLLNYIAKKYPEHEFYTTAYQVSKKAPTEKLEPNVGVFISTINLPKGKSLHENSRPTQKFLDLIKNWSLYTNQIYVWDYASNFDDYLSPLTDLNRIKEQFSFFKDHQIEGMFLNGSGYQYSTFDDLKTYVISQLMVNHKLEVDSLVARFFERFYPTSHQVLSDYYLKSQRKFDLKNKGYYMYDGFKNISQKYVDKNDFLNFYYKIKSHIQYANSDEKESLNKLLTAITYTRLQFYFLDQSKIWDEKDKLRQDFKEELQLLKNYTIFENLSTYKEENGHIAVYIKAWEDIIQRGKINNHLKNHLQVLSQPDDSFGKLNLLTDQNIGMSHDYHQGWYISSIDDLHIKANTKNLSGVYEVLLRFLNLEKHKIFAPSKIELYIDGNLNQTYYINEKVRQPEISQKIKLNLTDISEFKLKIFRQAKHMKKQMATDEILMTKLKE